VKVASTKQRSFHKALQQMKEEAVEIKRNDITSSEEGIERR
jgi:hypothetical protein